MFDSLVVIATFSLVMMVASPLLLAVLLTWMPADYFAREEPGPSRWAGRHPAARAAFHLAKNASGVLLVAAGVVMLVTPGQGVLTIVAGLMFIDFPGKRAVELRIVRNPKVLHAINALRARAHHPPLDLPGGFSSPPPRRK